MKKLLLSYWPFFLFLLVFFVIFYKVFLNSLYPFPGDLLVSWFFPYSSGGWEGYSSWITHKEFIAADVVRQIYPWRHLALDIIKEGGVPLWNPYAFSGTPLLANVQSAVFYPLNILFFFFSSQVSWLVYILIQPLLAFLFMYLFLRGLSLSKYAGFFGGFAFAFIGYTMIWFESGVVGHSALWLPLVLWGIAKFFNTTKTKYLLIAVTGLTCSIFAGHTQTTVYIYLLSVSYYVFILMQKRRFKDLIKHFWFFLLPFGLTAIQLLPSIELFLLSARGASESLSIFHKYQLPFEHLVTFFAPDFFGNPATGNFWGKDYGEFMGYIGIVAIVFAVIGLWHNKKNSQVRFFAVSSLIALLFAISSPLSEALPFFHIPILGTGIPARSLFIVAFSLVVLGSFGVESFLKQKISFRPVILIALLYSSLWIFVLVVPIILPKVSYLSSLSIAKRNLFLPTMIFIIVAVCVAISRFRPKLRLVSVFIFVLLMIGEYQFFLYKYLSFSPSSYMFPNQTLVAKLQNINTSDRIYGYYTSHPETNLSTEWRLQSAEGYDSLYIKRYGELFAFAKKDGDFDSLQRSDANFEDTLPGNDSYAKQVIMNMLGVRYILDKDDEVIPNNKEEDMYPPNRFRLVWQKDNWKVFENINSLPRAAVFYNTQVMKDDRKMLETLFTKSFPYQSILLLEESIPDFKNNAGLAITPAKITKYSGNKLTIEVTAKEDGLLFLSDAYYPGWMAKVDEKEVPITRANYAFRAIPVMKGYHMIEFFYRPISFLVGMIITVLSICFSLFLFLKTRYEK